MLAFHGFRVAGYAAAGGLLAGGFQWLAWAGQGAAILKPIWALLHMSGLALGAWMMLTATPPQWITRIGRVRPADRPAAPVRVTFSANRTMGNALIGSAWVLWPCGLLQSALVVAGLTHSTAAGAAAMTVFAMGSAPGLLAAPFLWRRLERAGLRSNSGIRLAGLLLLVASVWALGQDLLVRAWNYCFG